MEILTSLLAPPTLFGDPRIVQWAGRCKDEKREELVALKQVMKDHMLTYYIMCIREGSTRSEEVGTPLVHFPHFSLKKFIEQQQQ